MKKEERLHRLFGDVDDDLVAQAAHRPIPLRVWLPRVTAIAAAVALVVGLALAQPWAQEQPPIAGGSTTTTVQQNAPVDDPSHEGGNHPVIPPTGGTPTITIGTGGETWYEPKWDEKPICQRYPDFERFEKGNYIVHETTVDAAKVGEYLQDVNLHGYDIYTETAYTVAGKIYRIKGINDVCAVALQYPGRSDFFPAVNTKYVPATLGELIEDLNLRENLRVGTVYYSYHDEDGRIHDMQYSGLTVEKAWELLMSDTTLPNVADQPIEWKHKVSFRMDVPLLGVTNIGIPLSEDGYMRIYLLGAEKIFHIGEDKVDTFLAYVQEHCRLQKDDELIALPGDTTHPDTTMTSSAQPPLVTGTTVKPAD